MDQPECVGGGYNIVTRETDYGYIGAGTRVF